ncbi:MAG: hypothetical protein AAF500_09375 [Myxococcota bacterium]
MNGQVVAAALCLVALTGCDCGKRQEPEAAPPTEAALPPGFDRVMAEHEGLAFAARDALIRGDLDRARQSMRELAFFMENTPYPDGGQDFARITKALAAEVRSGRDLEEACMAFARLSHACGQCHHALNRGPPVRLAPAPAGRDVKIHMQRHYWAVERMWEALLTNSPRTFQRAASVLAEAPLHGERVPDAENPAGASRLAYEVHDLAFAAAVEGSNVADDYVPGPRERRASRPTTRGQAEIFGQILYTCNQCHDQLGVAPTLPDGPQRKGAL